MREGLPTCIRKAQPIKITIFFVLVRIELAATCFLSLGQANRLLAVASVVSYMRVVSIFSSNTQHVSLKVKLFPSNIPFVMSELALQVQVVFSPPLQTQQHFQGSVLPG